MATASRAAYPLAAAITTSPLRNTQNASPVVTRERERITLPGGGTLFPGLTGKLVVIEMPRHAVCPRRPRQKIGCPG
jgi:hypothetical protein